MDNGYSMYVEKQYWGIDVGKGYEITLTDASNLCGVYIRIIEGTVCNNLVFKPMITTDLSATYDDFVPYTGDRDTLTADVASLKNDLDNNHMMISKTHTFSGIQKSYKIKNLTSENQDFIITSIYRATGAATECDGNIVIHKETTNGIKVIKTFGASEVSVTYNSELNEINITTTKGYMTFIIQSNKNYIME